MNENRDPFISDDAAEPQRTQRNCVEETRKNGNIDSKYLIRIRE